MRKKNRTKAGGGGSDQKGDTSSKPGGRARPNQKGGGLLGAQAGRPQINPVYVDPRAWTLGR